MDEELGRDECFGMPGTGSALRLTHPVQIVSQRHASFLPRRVACIWDKGYVSTNRHRGIPFWAAALVHPIKLPAWRNRLLWYGSGIREEHFLHVPILLEPKLVSEKCIWR